MAENREPDFTGWATKANMRCSDGRTIMPGAFKHMDKKKVPLVWMHQHTEPENILGHALLEDRAFGTYTQAWFNETQKGKDMKLAVQHGDIESLSIYANNLKERKVGASNDRMVHYGDIKEVSLVIAGANPGALIENIGVIRHDGAYDELEDEAIITTGLALNHSEEGVTDVAFNTSNDDAALSHEDAVVTEEPTELDEDYVRREFENMSEAHKNIALFLAGAAFEAGQEAAKTEDAPATEDLAQSGTSTTDGPAVSEGLLAHFNNSDAVQKGLDEMNVFDRTNAPRVSPADGSVLSHAQQASLLELAKKGNGTSLKHIVTETDTLSHADYGVDDISLLFPDNTLDGGPNLIARETGWVGIVLGGVKKQPFAKIKSLTFDITAPEARARGYIKGTEKKDEVVKLLKRTTGPTTVYKKQKLDRDDIIDITDFDIVAWLKWEIRFMLDEEIARAILISDGRGDSNPDKILDPEGEINGVGIRSILKDHEMYSIKVVLDANSSVEDRMEEITRSRSKYRGSGSPTFFTTDAEITDMLLLKDKVGRRLYGTEAELASVLRVKNIIPVEVMEEAEGVLGIIVNLQDYTVGANRGGAVAFFSDFDIDFNQEKYLMETRISGALNRPKSAIVLMRDEGIAVASVAAPSFDGATNTVTITPTTGVIYTINDEPVTGNVVIEEDSTVVAKPAEGYYIPAGTNRDWSYTYSE